MLNLNITNDYGLELDSFLGAIYLPWHSIAGITLAVITLKIVRRYKATHSPAPFTEGELSETITGHE
jgi:hypothetical protein